MYNSRAFVADVNFNAKTVSLGADRTWVAEDARLETLSLVQDFDENPARAVAANLRIVSGRIHAYGVSINAGATSASDILTYLFATTHIQIMSNTVGVGNSRALVCTRTATAVLATLLNYSGTTVGLDTSFTLPISPVAAATDIHPIGLFCYNKSERRCVLLYRIGDNRFALPINISAAGGAGSVTAGTVQPLGNSSEVLSEAMTAYVSGGTDRFWVKDNRIILMGSTAGNGGGPLRIQILSVSSTGVITRGAITTLPVLNPNAAERGSIGLTYRGNNRLYITGVDLEVSPRDACLLDCGLSGTNIVSVMKYRPFRRLRTDSPDIHRMKNAAWENPNNPGEFLFMQQFNSSPLTNMQFWFGRKDDNTSPTHIIGIALEDSAKGQVRVQTSAKHITGIFGNLQAGALYSAGENGGILPFTSAANTKPAGVGTGPGDLYFFGAMSL